MRTFLLIVGTIVAIMAFVVLYILMQPPVPPRASPLPLATKPPAATLPVASQTIIQAGQDVWFRVPDERGGIKWQFRASRYDPQPDNSINVIEPEAEFFLGNDRMVRIRGTHGRVVVPPEVAGRSDVRGPAAPPSRGELYHVTIDLLSASEPRRVLLSCRVNNIAFDTDTFRIATESYTLPDGTIVPADQVPVEVRGEEYDFDGRGLTIYWNDRDRRLQMLEIAHGQSLAVKQPLRQNSPAKAASHRGHSTAERGVAPRPAAPVEHPVQSANVPGSTVVYRATFHGPVRVMQAGQEIAQADMMRLVFIGGETELPGTAAPEKSHVSPTVHRSAHRPAPRATEATTDQPLLIYWPGKLLVEPVSGDAVRVQPDRPVVELVSQLNPVALNRAGSQMKCASVLYRSADESLEVNSSPLVPQITLKDSTGAVICATSLRYSGAEGRALLDGPGNGEVPLQDRQAQSAETMKVRWSKSCEMKFDGSDLQRLLIRHVDVLGDVNVEHPRLKLRSDSLEASFEPGGNEPGAGELHLVDMLAAGDVRCELIEGENHRRIEAERLTLASEQSSPRIITADGRVRVFDDEQDLRANHLVVKLSPTTRPTDQPQIESVFAQQDVRVAFKDVTGQCDQLTAVASGDDYDVKLSGQPHASLNIGQSMLTGPIINLQPGRQNVQVVGPGTFRGVDGSQPQLQQRSFDVRWENGMSYEGSTGRVQVSGGVALATVADDGAAITATGSRLDMTLRRQSPSTLQIADASASHHPELDSFSLEGDVEISSVLTGPGGEVLRRMHLFAPVARAEQGVKRFVVPAAGRMLYEDHRPAQQGASLLGEMSGATAFQWDHRFSFEQGNGEAEMTGGVVIAHEGGGEPFRLEAGRVLAKFTEASQPATQPADVKLTQLVADGGVRFLSRQIHFDADHMSFDAAEGLLTASGSLISPVQIYDPNGLSIGTVRQAWWNTRTDQIGAREIQAMIRK